MKKGWALLRVSNLKQALVQHGSLEQQRNMVTRWAKDQSEKSEYIYRIDRYIEEDISGRGQSLHKRTELHELERAIEKKSIDFFVIEKVDRMARDMIFNLSLVKKAQKNNVEIFEFESGLIDFKNRGSRLGFNIKNMMAEEYSLELEEKITKKQREALVNNGKDSSTCPILGLDAHPTKTCMYVHNKKEIRIVVDIFSKFEMLGELKALEKYCVEKGYKTKVRWTKEKVDNNGNIIPSRKMGGELFNATTLRAHLTNSKYRGFKVFRDTWNQFPNLQDENGCVIGHFAHEPVIEIDLFNRVQARLAKNKKHGAKTNQNGNVYLLSGALQTEDGERFQGHSAKGGRNLYYHSKAYNMRISKKYIESIVCDRVKGYLKESGTLDKVISSTLKHQLLGLPFVEEEIIEAKRKVSDLQRTVDAFTEKLRQAVLEGSPGLDDLLKIITEEKAKIEEELIEWRKRLEQAREKKEKLTTRFRGKIVRDYLDLIMSRFDEKSDQQKKTIIQAIIPKITVHSGRKLTLTIQSDLGGISANFGQKKARPYGCHTEDTKVRVIEKWRIRRSRVF